ncbi:16S rRNA (adenine(1518)-N(6)/adenine(1519)-N(6))-dimethyltransferaseRsmA [soil metagenome]
MAEGRRRALLTPTDVRRLLSRYGLAPRKAHGQNFVVDANTVRKVVRHAEIVSGQTVWEIGPGLGSLTLALREAGALVVAVEIDAGMVAALREVISDDDGVAIVHADALTVDLAAILPDEPVPLVANLPYSTATALVLRALLSGRCARALVMVQKEVGQRWAATVGNASYSAVSVKLAALADITVVGPVSRRAFHPVPGVDSVTVRMLPRPWRHAVDREALFGLVQAGFAQRRKRLRNALAAGGHRPVDVEAALVAVARDPGSRAEELDLDAWAALAERLGRP